MTSFSHLRLKRFNLRQSQVAKKFIVFQLHQEWFALPLEAIEKVIPLGKVYGDPQNKGLSLTKYEDKELLVIDVGLRLFQKTNFIQDEAQQRYLLILGKEKTDFIGLPIDSAPSIRPVTEDSFKPIPEIYLTRGNIKCLSSQMIELPEQPPFFVLDPIQLLQSFI